MSTAAQAGGRLSIWQAAYVVARRDFVAILFSRAFIFFLLGPLFPIVVGALAGGIGSKVAADAARPQIGIAMVSADMDRMLVAHAELTDKLGPAMPDMRELIRLEPGQPFDPRRALEGDKGNLAAILSGTPAAPELTAPAERIERWAGDVALVAARAEQANPTVYPQVTLLTVATSGAREKSAQMKTAQAGQMLLFLLIMLLAGMVLSNLVEEKGNKIIEVLAAAIPMDAVFLGKLFAMLAVSLVGITVWAATIGGLIALAGMDGNSLGPIDLANLPAPGVGWPLFFLFGVIYFAMGYLLLGSIFLAIGSMASTVREVQTLSMPVTMLQVFLFLFATLAVADRGGWMEWTAIAFPFSSPFAMLARAAQDESAWPHAVALAWQAGWVLLSIRLGAALFRTRVMKSGPQGARRRRPWQRAAAAVAQGPRRA